MRRYMTGAIGNFLQIRPVGTNLRPHQLPIYCRLFKRLSFRQGRYTLKPSTVQRPQVSTMPT